MIKVIAFLGVCSNPQSVMIVMELAPNGSLRDYLIKGYTTRSLPLHPIRLGFIVDIAAGMEYISSIGTC